jgi:hypothetical protein
MVNFSAQLEGLASYLEDTPDVAEDEATPEGSLSAYRHRCQGAALLTRSLTSSNEVFSSDWLGVASPMVAKRIEGRFAQFKQKKEKEEEQTVLEQQLLDIGSQDAVELNKVKAEIAQLKTPSKNRPLPEIPKVARSQPKAIEVLQESDEATEHLQKGTIVLRLKRASRFASGMGKLMPRMPRIPTATLEFLGGPSEFDHSLLTYNSNPGTKFDFPVNLKSPEGSLLPPGDYRFRYEVKVAEPTIEKKESAAEPLPPPYSSHRAGSPSGEA